MKLINDKENKKNMFIYNISNDNYLYSLSFIIKH